MLLALAAGAVRPCGPAAPALRVANSGCHIWAGSPPRRDPAPAGPRLRVDSGHATRKGPRECDACVAAASKGLSRVMAPSMFLVRFADAPRARRPMRESCCRAPAPRLTSPPSARSTRVRAGAARRSATEVHARMLVPPPPPRRLSWRSRDRARAVCARSQRRQALPVSARDSARGPRPRAAVRGWFQRAAGHIRVLLRCALACTAFRCRVGL